MLGVVATRWAAAPLPKSRRTMLWMESPIDEFHTVQDTSYKGSHFVRVEFTAAELAKSIATLPSAMAMSLVES